MARSKVGGSSGKLKGQVGDVVYQVKKNSDGTYTQYVYSKGERTEETVTPLLQAQRMITAIVQSVTKELKEVLRLSYQNARTKIASLNELSSMNIRLVKNDAQMHWYGDNKFIFVGHSRYEEYVRDLGGPFRLSQGTLLKDLFDEYIYDEFPARYWQVDSVWRYVMYGMKFTCNMGAETVSQFMQKHALTYSDYFIMCGFHEWTTYDEEEEAYVYHDKHRYVIAQLNMLVPGSSIITPELLSELFIIKSTKAPSLVVAVDNKSFCLCWLCTTWENDEIMWNISCFSISYWGGRKRVKTASYHNPEGGDSPWVFDQYPAAVFGSWMGEPWVFPYQNPYSSQPAPRVPGEYREVAWLQSDKQVRFDIGDSYWARRYAFSIQVMKLGSGTNEVFRTEDEAGGLFVSVAPSAVTMQIHDNNNVPKGGTVSVATVGEVITICSEFVGNDVQLRASDVAVVVPDAELPTVAHYPELYLWYNANSGGPIRVYSVTIYSNQGATVRSNYIPCYRKSDHVAGFYDVQHRHFYSLGSKTSLVVVGPDV